MFAKQRRIVIAGVVIGCVLIIGSILAAIYAEKLHFLPEFLTQGQKQIEGSAVWTDADTVVIHSQKIRLQGIDAPEMGQLCGEIKCGVVALSKLRAWIGGKNVRCVQAAPNDRYGRWIAKCFVDSADIGDWLVRQGWAVAYLRYSEDYIEAEAEARRKHRGLWKLGFVLPESWRRDH